MIVLILTINILFIDDSTFHNIYIKEGALDLFFNIPNIAYSSVISYFFYLIIKEAIFTENIFISLKRRVSIQNRRAIGYFSIKFVMFYGLGIIMLSLFLFYVMCFFTIFPNIQIFVFAISGISFGFFSIIPFFTDLIPPVFRLFSLVPKKEREFFYNFSQFLHLI